MTVEAPASLNWPPFMYTANDNKADRTLTRRAIVLAGGQGARMRPTIGHWLGEDRPKQYCAFVGSRSMLQHTIDRARSVVSEEHVVTVIGRGHREFLVKSAKTHLPGRVLEEPGNMGTAPGIFLSLAYVLADDPAATVILLPSDHFAHPEDQFCAHMVHAFELAENYPERIVLVGALPDRAETDYGWIAPAAIRTDGRGPLTHGAMHVDRFQEKPGRDEATALLNRGCLWNTMVITAKAKTLWALGRLFLPETMYEFDAFLTVLRAVRTGRLDPKVEDSALAAIYTELAPADFSRDILQNVSRQSVVLPMHGVNWCDWGRPQRVTETLAFLGLRPFFAADRMENFLEATTLANGRHESGGAMKQTEHAAMIEHVILSYADMCYSVAFALTRDPDRAQELAMHALTWAWHLRDSARFENDIKKTLLTTLRKRFLEHYCQARGNLRYEQELPEKTWSCGPQDAERNFGTAVAIRL